jgi:hypothetical protein
MNAFSGEHLTGVFLPMKSTEKPRTTSAAHSATFTDEARFCRTAAALTARRAAQSAAR